MLPYFFAARHTHYARYITWHLLEMRCLSAAAKADLVSGAFVCRHRQGSWNAVSSDQFGEQTAIKIGKGGLKGITLDPVMVTEWISAFPIGAYICDTVDLLHEEDQPNEKEVLHKEEGFSRRRLDADDRRRVANELCKHSHPLEGRGEDNVLYNIVNGKIAPPAVNVADAVSIGDKMLSVFRKSHPSGFHAKMSSPVKTMEYLKRGVKVGEKTVFDAESIFLRILMVGQQRHLQLAPIFSYQLCAVPPSLVDEFGCLRRGNKGALMNRLGIKLSRPRSPDIVIVDGQQPLYHVTWPCGGDPSVLVASMKARLASLPGECVLVFDRYDHVSPKDHERMRRGGVGSMNYNLAINSPLPSRDAILKNKHNKRQLSWVLSTFDMSTAVTIDTQYTGVFGHEEAGVTIISYVLQAVGEGKNVVRVLCDDTDVFVLLVFWMWRNQLVDKCQMQMERCDGTVLDINQTCTKLGSKCLQ